MTGFTVAVERRQWRVVALYLALGISEAASRLPPESLAALVELLAGEGPPRPERPNAR